MQQYQLLSQLLRPLGFSIARLEMSDRGGWALTTAQGVEIQIGRDHVVDKIRRFVSIYDKALKDQISNIARIDLRYPNGPPLRGASRSRPRRRPRPAPCSELRRQ